MTYKPLWCSGLSGRLPIGSLCLFISIFIYLLVAIASLLDTQHERNNGERKPSSSLVMFWLVGYTCYVMLVILVACCALIG